MRILKFGGTSLNGPERLSTVASIIEQRAQGNPCVVVISALAGITDALESAIRRASDQAEVDRSLSDHLITRHLGCIRQLADEEATQPYVAQLSTAIVKLDRLLGGVALLSECPATTRAEILAIGERLAAPLLCAALRRRNFAASIFDGSELITLNSQRAVDLEETSRRAKAALGPRSDFPIAVITGFLARDPTGCTTTLGRGASDYSATLLAAALGADEVEIWTDVNGVMSADPRHVPEAVNVPHLTYDEAAELAGLGAGVLHPQTLEPVAVWGIPIRICNTLNPDHPGTVVDNNTKEKPAQAVTAIPRVVRFDFRTHDTLYPYDLAASAGLSEPPLLLSWETPRRNLSVVVHQAEAASIELATRRQQPTPSTLQLIRKQELALVAVFGHSPTLPPLFDLLAEEHISLYGLHLPDGPAGAISLLLSRGDAGRAVRVLHRALVGTGLPPTTPHPYVNLNRTETSATHLV